MTSYATVAVPVPGEGVFTYSVPEGGGVCVGQQVLVPFARRRALQRGFVVALAEESAIEPARIKPIERVVTPEPAISDDVFDLCRWVADYYCCSLGEALAAAYPFHEDMAPRTQEVLSLVRQALEGLTLTAKQEQAVRTLAQAGDDAGWTRKNLAQESGVSLSVIAGLVRAGVLCTRRVHVARDGAPASGLHAYERPELSEAQRRALEAATGEPRPVLLFGVTGSGKTEVYMTAIEEALARGRRALVLVPEIGLTPQAVDRYRHRLGDGVGVLHSGLSDGERYDTWWAARRGELRVLIGTRSAVFAPLPDLGLVVVDEEHDGSYKQEDPAPRYHARDVAVVRAQRAGAAAILGSATPSMESFTNAQNGKYRLVELPERVVPHGLPPVRVIDHRGRSEEETVITNELADGLAARLERGEQSLLLLNRRGYAAQVLCGTCGNVVMCRQCSVPMSYHRTRELLLCHYCDSTEHVPLVCPACEQPFVRMRGIGTQQVVEWVCGRFPEARVERMDTDATRSKQSHRAILDRFRGGEIDVLVGTQMVAKGLDVPGVTLVGVVNADAGLVLPDFRAAERAFALLAQVAGRAGRGTEAGEVLVQTYCPNHYSVLLAIRHDYRGFYERECRFRRAVRFPPFARLVLLRVEARREAAVQPATALLHKALREGIAEHQLERVRIIGPTEAPLYQLQGWFRWQVVLAGASAAQLHALLRLEQVAGTIARLRSRVKVVIDVDPASLL